MESFPVRGRHADERRVHDRRPRADPRVRVDPVIARVQVINPLACYGRAFDQCLAGITAAKERMAGLAETAGLGAVIVAGDFNSTPDVQQFRDLLSNGYRDSVEQTGAWFAPTFPSRPALPPLNHHRPCAYTAYRGCVDPRHRPARVRSPCTPSAQSTRPLDPVSPQKCIEHRGAPLMGLGMLPPAAWSHAAAVWTGCTPTTRNRWSSGSTAS